MSKKQKRAAAKAVNPTAVCGGDDDRVLTVEEAAAFLRCSESGLNKWRMTGNGPKFVYVGTRVRYRRADLIEYLNRRTCASTSAQFAPATA